MNKKTFIVTLILTAVIFISLASPGEALKKYRREIGITYNNNDGNLTSNITLSWTFQTGDTLWKMTDGSTWNSVSIGPYSAGETATHTENNVPYYSVIYFELREPGYDDTNRFNSDTITPPKFTTVPVYPPLSNAHSELSQNTRWCAGCHVTHAAEGPYLMKAPNRTALCLTCHNGTGSRYDVEKGLVTAKNGEKTKALGGAFVGGSVYYPTITSTHVYTATEQNYAPGYNTPGTLWNDIDCNDCHSSHADSSSYRMLKRDDNNGGNVYAWIKNSDGLSTETAFYENVDNMGCIYCHDKYNTTQGSNNGNYPVFGVSHYVYRHDTTSSILSYTDRDGNTTALSTDLPLDTNASGTEKKLMCLTCHYPHGTNAIGSDLSSFDKNKNGTFGENPGDLTTALKRRDYYGVCQDCHKK